MNDTTCAQELDRRPVKYRPLSPADQAALNVAMAEHYGDNVSGSTASIPSIAQSPTDVPNEAHE